MRGSVKSVGINHVQVTLAALSENGTVSIHILTVAPMPMTSCVFCMTVFIRCCVHALRLAPLKYDIDFCRCMMTCIR